MSAVRAWWLPVAAYTLFAFTVSAVFAATGAPSATTLTGVVLRLCLYVPFWVAVVTPWARRRAER